MLFYDWENLREGLRRRDAKRDYSLGKIQYLLSSFLQDILGPECSKGDFIRAYAYTGAYSDELISRVERDFNSSTELEKPKIKALLEKTKRKFEGQKKFFERAKYFNFLELRTLPLQYQEGHIFQKGIDVQLAVDLVSHGHKNNYDVAVIASGDLDLTESLRLIKSLGKKAIVFSHFDLTSKSMIREADYFIDIAKLKDEDLEMISFKNTNPA